MHSKAVPGELSVPFLDHDLDAAVHISADVASIQQIVVLGIENSNFLALNAVLHEFELDRNTATNSELPLIFRQAALGGVASQADQAGAPRLIEKFLNLFFAG